MTYSNDFMKWVTVMANRFSLDFSSFGRRINGKRKGVIIVDTCTGKVAYSWCNPADEWNDDIGIALAYARLRNVPIPEMEKLPTVEECVGKWIELTYNSYFYVTPITIKGEKVCVNRSGLSIRIKQNETCKIIQ